MVVGGPGACSPGFLLKRFILKVPKHVIINLKIDNFKDNNSTNNKNNADQHVTTKVNTSTFLIQGDVGLKFFF